MHYKPADFFLGVMEFFAILMPGALLTFLMIDWGAPLFGVLLPRLPGTTAKWLAFAVSSYVLGHLLHHLGAILDKWIYDNLYVKKWKRRRGEERLLVKTRELMNEALGTDAQMTSAFSWATSFVRLNSDAAATELERGGADSKFFRSLSIVALVAMALFLAKGEWVACGGAFPLLVFSLWRFCGRRWTNSQLTYEYFIMLNMVGSGKGMRLPDDADSTRVA